MSDKVYVLWSDYDEIGAVFLNREAAERAWELSERGGRRNVRPAGQALR